MASSSSTRLLYLRLYFGLLGFLGLGDHVCRGARRGIYELLLELQRVVHAVVRDNLLLHTARRSGVVGDRLECLEGAILS